MRLDLKVRASTPDQIAAALRDLADDIEAGRVESNALCCRTEWESDYDFWDTDSLWAERSELKGIHPHKERK
jgi:hypothetical protein